MKKKRNQTYYNSFNLSKLDKELPLNLREIKDIVETVAYKYPYVSKTQISLIIKSFLEEMRSQLIQGNVISIRDFMNDMRLFTFCKLKNDKLSYYTKIQVRTPYKIKFSS